MQQMTGDYLAMLPGSHSPVVVADCWWNGRSVARNMPIIGGSVTVTAGQAVRSNLTLDIADMDGKLTPRADGVLSPYGSEINVKAGMRRGPILDLCSLGWFVVQEAASESSYRTYGPDGQAPTIYVQGGGTVSITAVDRAVRVQDSPFMVRTQPIKPTVLLEIGRILQGVVPWRPPAFADKSLAAGAVTYEDDRMKALTDLADLLDAEPIADAAGSVTLVKKVMPIAPIWEIPRGQGGILTAVDRKLSRTGMHNAIVARCTAFEGPLQAVAYETNPALKWGGPFGMVPRFIDVPLAGSVAELARAAATELQVEQRQRWQEVSFESVTNYALEVGDVITVPMGRGKISGPVTALTKPLTPGPMNGTMTVDPFVLAQVA